VLNQEPAVGLRAIAAKVFGLGV